MRCGVETGAGIGVRVVVGTGTGVGMEMQIEIGTEIGGYGMQIGEVIRKYRKEKNMTQEEMARRLGVTAPAVNKWENGNSLPDIALLAPIARLLDISLDTLLSFQKELTQEEIRQLIYEMDEKLRSEDYEEVFRWARGILEKYPNCQELALQAATVLNAWCLMKRIPDAG